MLDDYISQQLLKQNDSPRRNLPSLSFPLLEDPLRKLLNYLKAMGEATQKGDSEWFTHLNHYSFSPLETSLFGWNLDQHPLAPLFDGARNYFAMSLCPELSPEQRQRQYHLGRGYLTLLEGKLTAAN